MIVKGLIKTIDFSANTCTVRLPLFETAASKGEVILEAVMMSQPGLYNGYVEGDIVFVDFENDELSQPIVIGKLYLGASKEAAATPHSSMALSNLVVTKEATLPIDTRLVLEDTTSAVPVENGITSYKSIIDIIKALHKTETTIDQAVEDQSEVIATIKIEYLSQPNSASAPDAGNPSWQAATPEYADEYSIWQKTTCYNHRGQILSVEILCLTDLNASAMYRLRCSTKVHAGPNQTEALTILAMVKLGSGLEIEDNAAVIRYRWGEYGSTTDIGGSRLVLPASELQEKNLIIELLHRDTGSPEETIYHTYDTETLMYAPLNTPIILLSKDTDVMLYTADGSRKLGDDVISTAQLYVNGDILDATYSWSWDSSRCTCSYPLDDNSQPIKNSIKVSAVNSETRTGTATCTAVVTKEGPFFGKSYTKDFTVTQTRVGENATSYWLTTSCTVHTGKKHKEPLVVTAMKQFGVSTEEIDTTARLWWKYKSEAKSKWRLPEDDLYRLTLAYNNISDDDILVLATHNVSFDPKTEGVDLLTDQNIYEREEITFSPLNTPVLSLTNDSGVILYGSNGQKMNAEDTVSTTAELYLNGAKLPDTDITYKWEVTDCITDSNASEGIVATTPSITIKDLTENTATATCTATYKDEPYTKTFIVAKQVQGISIVSQTVYYALIKNSFEADTIAPPVFDTESKTTDLIVKTKAGVTLTSTEVLGRWATTPPAHTSETNGWKYWTTVETVYSTGALSFSDPIINEDLSGVYALAQGKSTNYYGEIDPAGSESDKHQGTYGTVHSSQKKAIKDNDCWFCTKEVATYTAYKTFSNLPEYIGYFIKDGDNYYEVKPDNLEDESISIEVGTTMAYKKTSNSPTLYQWNNGKWEDVGNELIANKVTANYINALDITAQKVKILDANAATLFEANGLYRDETDRLDPYVTIGGFTVHENTLTTGELEAGNLINISSDNTNIFSVTEGLSDLTASRTTTWSSGIAKVAGAFKRKSQLVAVTGSGSSTPNFYKYQAFNDFTSTTYYSVAKITFKQEAPSFTLYLNCNSSNRTADYVMASNKFEKNYTGDIPGLYTDSSAKTSTYGLNTSTLRTVTYENIKKDQFIYIVYRHGSNVHTSTIGANVFLPVNIRLSIGENFQVLADGTVFAKNLYLGVDPSTDAAGQITAVNADLQTAKGELSAAIADVETLIADEVEALEATISSINTNKIEVKNSSNATIFKADGVTSGLADGDRVQIGGSSGFKVGTKKLYAGSNTNYVELGTEAIMLGGTTTSAAPFSVTKAGYLKAESGKIGGFDLSGTSITSSSGAVGLNSSATEGTHAFWAGDADAEDAPFSVTNTGTLTATSAKIKGYIEAEGGKLGKFAFLNEGLESPAIKINPNQIYFPEAAVFNLEDKVNIYSDSSASYIVTSGENRDFIIKNTSGAGIKFYRNPTDQSSTIVVTIKNVKLRVVSKGGYGVNYYIIEMDFDYEISAPLTISYTANFTVQYYQPWTTFNKAGSYTFSNADGTYGSKTITLDTDTGSSNPEFKGIKGGNNSSYTTGSIKFNAQQISASNKTLYSLGSFCPDTTSTNVNTGLYLGDTNHRWNSIVSYTSNITTSDRNQKHDIKDLSLNYDGFFDGLRPVSFIYNESDSGRTHLGYIAQEVEESLCKNNIETKDFAGICIDKNADNSGLVYALRYEEFIPLNTDQIQKLKKRVTEQDARIAELENLVKELKT